MPSQREQHFLLAPGQSATRVMLKAEKETIQLLGAQGPVRVTLAAPEGKVFKVNELENYTFTTEIGQRHNWLFDLVNPRTGQQTGTTTFSMTTLSSPSTGQRSNEYRVRQGKHNTHVHSYYFFSAAPTQREMQINLGEYITPGITYFHVVGSGPSFDAVLKAPPGEAFAWPDKDPYFDDSMEGKPVPERTHRKKEYRVAGGPAMLANKYWFADANERLYSRSVGLQYAGPASQ